MIHENFDKTNSNNFLKKKIVFFILLLLISGPKIKESLDLTLFSASIFIFFALKRILFNRNLNFIDLYFFLTNIILLFIYFFLKIKEINYSEYFYTYSIEFLKIIFYNFAIYGVITIYKKLYEDYQSKLSGDLISCVIIVSLSTIIFLIYPDLRNFLYSNIDLYILKDRVESFQYRVTDLSIGGSTISAVFAYFYFFIDFHYRKNYSIKILTYKLVLIFSIVITARTGLILILFFYLLNVLCFNRIFRFRFNIRYLSKFLILTLIFSTFFYVLIANNQTLSDQFLYQIYPWVFKVFSPLVGIYSNDASLEFIINQFKLLPTNLIYGSDIMHLIENEVGLKIDSSLLNIWHHGTIFAPSLTLFWFFLSFFILSYKKIQLKQFKILLVFVIIIILLNLKDSFLGSARGGIALFLLINYIFLSSHLVNKSSHHI
jgi:hypothetical protein